MATSNLAASNPVNQLNIRPAEHRTPGIKTFYVESETKPGLEYTVQQIRQQGMKRWQCSCPQFFYRCVRERTNCKHIHAVKRSLKVTISAEQAELIELTSQWKSAGCLDCFAVLRSEVEARQHTANGHDVLNLYDSRPVN